MRIEPALARQLAELARLELSEARLLSLTDELSRILDYVDQLPTVEATHAPTAAEVRVPWRVDVAVLPGAERVAAASEGWVGAYVGVPRVAPG